MLHSALLRYYIGDAIIQCTVSDDNRRLGGTRMQVKMVVLAISFKRSLLYQLLRPEHYTQIGLRKVFANEVFFVLLTSPPCNISH